MSKKILIVGSGGFLATSLAQIIAMEKDTTIVGLSRTFNANPNITFNYVDMKALAKAHQRFDCIYMLAAFIPYGHFNEPSNDLVETNIKLVFEISSIYPDAKFIYASSVAVYGQTENLPIKIETAFSDPNLYGLSKLAAEAIVRNQNKFSVIRFSSLIGRGMNEKSFIPSVINSARTGKIILYGNGSRLQNYLDIRDAAEMCLAAADQAENLIVLGGARQSFSNIEVANIVKSSLDAMIEYRGENNSPSYVYETEESQRLLNYIPKYSLEQSIKEIISS